MNNREKHTNNYYKDIFDNTKEALIVLNQDLIVEELNDNAEEIFKISREKAKGNKTRLFVPELIEELALKSIKENRSVQGNDIECKIRKGDSITLDIVSIPFHSSYDASHKILLQIRDTSWNKHIVQKSLQESTNTMFEKLIMGLSHELKNPLSGIKGAAQILLDAIDSDENKRTVGIIAKEINRLNRMLDNFTELELFTEEKLEPVDIHEVLSEIIHLEGKSIKSKGIQFVNDFDVTIPNIPGDFDTLKQAFLNIIKNSIDATPEKGKIVTTTRWNTKYKLQHESEIIIEIKDSGHGIEKDKLDKIFTPFYTTKNTGTGLGLFFSQQIINKHRGTIFVNSELNKGTNFIIYLPSVKSL